MTNGATKVYATIVFLRRFDNIAMHLAPGGGGGPDLGPPRAVSSASAAASP
jgi:hypothetical protein